MTTYVVNAHERTRAIWASRDEGATLEEIGAEHGLTRERVRQILKVSGYPVSRVTLKSERALEAKARLVADWLSVNGPVTSEAVRGEFGLGDGEWARLQATGIVPMHLVLAVSSRRSGVFTFGDTVEAVRRVYLEHKASRMDSDEAWLRVFTRSWYDAMRGDGDPSGVLITVRWGWGEVCRAAGVPFRDDGSGNHSSKWSDDDLVSWVRLFAAKAAAAGEPATFKGYESWARENGSAPSGSLVRVRLCGPDGLLWSDLVVGAARS